MTPSELKYHVESSGHETYFFDRKTMKFWGDTMRNYGVRKAVILANFDAEGVYHDAGIEREVWELYRKSPVKNGMKSSAYFDPETFRRAHAKV